MKSDRSDSGHKKRSGQSLVDPKTGKRSYAPDAIKYSTWHSRHPVDPVSGKKSNAPDSIQYGTWQKRRKVDPGTRIPSDATNAVPYYLCYSRELVDPVSGKKSNAPDAIPRYIRNGKLKKARLNASKTDELTNNPADTTFLSGFDLNFPPNSPSERIVPSEKQDSPQTSGIQSQQDEDILDLNVMPKEKAQTLPLVTQDSTNKRKSPEFTPEEISKEPDETSKKQRSQSILDQANKALLNSPLLFRSLYQNQRVFPAPNTNQRIYPAFFSPSPNSNPVSQAREIQVNVINSEVKKP